MAFIIPLFMWSDLRRVAHYAEKRWTARKPMMVRFGLVCYLVWSVDDHALDDKSQVGVNSAGIAYIDARFTAVCYPTLHV